jgi:hypothetical protein
LILKQTIMKFLAIFVVVATVVLAINPVGLGSCSNYVILAKTGISTSPISAITGDIAVSPAAESYLTGFSLTRDSTGTFSSSSQIAAPGKSFASDLADPTPSVLTTAVDDMTTAYNDAAGRSCVAANLNLQGGQITGTTFLPGVYEWSTNIEYSDSIYIKGSDTDLFIFKTTGNIITASVSQIVLLPAVDGGPVPLASNIVWQVAGYVTAGTNSVFKGTILSMTAVNFLTGSTLNGAIYAQTAVVLQSATITKA